MSARKFKINQKQLLDIANTWHLKKKAQFRIFKCANCRRRLRRAWYHWLRLGSFKTPVHLCKDCHKALKITYPKVRLDLRNAGIKVSRKKVEKFARLIKGWDIMAAPRYRYFYCDYCLKGIYKANHIPLKIKSKISEVHLCSKCWKEFRCR